MGYEQIQYEVAERIATVTLNRPDKLNAWTFAMQEELKDAMGKAERDDDVRVIILTGAGRGFCAGADLEALAWLKDLDLATVTRDELLAKCAPDPGRTGARPDFATTHTWLPSIAKPIIAAVNGPAVGLGLVLTLYCDLRIASDQARLGTAFAGRGLIGEYGIAWILPRLIGLANAMDLLFSSRIIDAAEALRMGLVSRVIPQAEFMPTVRQYASVLATQVSPRSMRVMKKQVYNGLFQTLKEAVDLANEEMLASFRGEDFREGVAHFLEKRLPRFTGR